MNIIYTKANPCLYPYPYLMPQKDNNVYSLKRYANCAKIKKKKWKIVAKCSTP